MKGDGPPVVRSVAAPGRWPGRRSAAASARMATGEARRRRDEALQHLLRQRVVSAIHAGTVAPGDRLPTYREVGGETGADLRAVARAYRALAEEGLVEVRGRAGVFVAPQEHIGGTVLAETARWMVGVLLGAETRQVSVPDFPDFVRRCVSSTVVRCVCVESTEDQTLALCHTLSERYGFHMAPVHAGALLQRAVDAGLPGRPPPEVLAADFLVTTLYHAAALRPLAGRTGKPLVAVRLHPDIVGEVQAALARGGLNVIHVDPAFRARIRLVAGERADRVHTALATDARALRRLDPSFPALVTRAAREAARGATLPESIATTPLLADESAGELIELLLRFNLEALRRRGREEGRER